MAEQGSGKSWWQSWSQPQGSGGLRDRQKSLDTKFADPTFLTDEPGFPAASHKPSITEGSSTQQAQSTYFSKFFGKADASPPPAAPAAPATPATKPRPTLKPIKTPHLEPISHPELAFSPSDIGVWEINKARKGQGSVFS